MDEMDIITLYDEKGRETDFEVLGVVSLEEDQYAVLLPTEDDEEELAYIFRIDTDEKGDEFLAEVEDDEEFELVRDAWEEFMEGDFYDLEDD